MRSSSSIVRWISPKSIVWLNCSVTRNIQIKEGVLNNLELYFDNEPARHKLLDVIGDLALCGRFIKGRVIAERPGHKANTSMAKMIYKEILAEEKDDAYPIECGFRCHSADGHQ